MVDVIGKMHDFDFVAFIQRQPQLVFAEQRCCFHWFFALVADCLYGLHGTYATLAVRATQAKLLATIELFAFSSRNLDSSTALTPLQLGGPSVRISVSEVAMAASWKGFITFGLISIPIELSPAARTERISFNQIHSVCHSRLKQPLY
ncbi:MAG: hypothetical protein WAN14_14295, partial [Candidatus Acidiferrales bacterium]